MATLNELKDALKDALDKRGTLNELKAKVRSEVFSAIDDTKGVPRPEPSEENEIINELIREYLKYNNYRNTLSVMIPETGIGEVTKKTRSDIRTDTFNFLAQVEKLSVKETQESRELPLLYSIFALRSKSST
ncbi:LisH domain-containing protein [Chloropicon primus]|nr:LisH domain-containing protein [Chloropicon primus]